MVEVPIKVSRALKQVAQSEEIGKKGLIPLIMALEIAEKHNENFEVKTGEQWMFEFFSKLTSVTEPAGKKKDSTFESKVQHHTDNLQRDIENNL